MSSHEGAIGGVGHSSVHRTRKLEEINPNLQVGGSYMAHQTSKIGNFLNGSEKIPNDKYV